MAQQNETVALVAIAGFPKSGNTLINETLNEAGGLVAPNWEPPKYEYHKQEDLDKLRSAGMSVNPFLGENRCHIKTHLAYTEQNYRPTSGNANIVSVLAIIRNPFDTLLSSTNYLRYSARLNKRLTPNQIATLKHFYPDYTEDDVINGEVFGLDQLREKGALDKALDIFSSSGTCVPQFLARSGTWIDFYRSFSNATQPFLMVRFEDIVTSTDFWQQASSRLAEFLNCDANTLAEAFLRQDEACKQAKQEKNPFFPVAEANYFYRYFEGKTLRRFCNKYSRQLNEVGYEDLADRILSS